LAQASMALPSSWLPPRGVKSSVTFGARFASCLPPRKRSRSFTVQSRRNLYVSTLPTLS
jgi:hypothetical protein